MRVPSSGLRIDSPSWPLLQAHISYWGITDAPGLANGTTIVCGALALEPPYDNHKLKLLSGPSAGQTRDITLHPAGTATLTVSAAFTPVTGVPQAIVAGTLFVIMSDTPSTAEVAALTVLVNTIETKLDLPVPNSGLNTTIAEVVGNDADTAADDPDANTLSLMSLLKSLMRSWKVVIPNIDVSLAAIDAVLAVTPAAGVPDAENTILDLAITPGTMYKIEDLVLKVSSYGAGGTTMTIQLWELLNGNVRANYVNTRSVIVPTDYAITVYLNLMDLFGKPTIVGDGIAITAIVDGQSVTGALTCTYTYSTARVS